MGPLLVGAAKGYASLVGFGLLFFVSVREQQDVLIEEMELEAVEAIEIPPDDPPARILPAE